jgi:hypothetical protein
MSPATKLLICHCTIFSSFLRDCNGHTNQQWYQDPQSGAITAKANPSKCIDLPGNNLDNGNKLQIWDCNLQDSQSWKYDSLLAHTIVLRKNKTKCFDMSGGVTDNGTPIEIWGE